MTFTTRRCRFCAEPVLAHSLGVLMKHAEFHGYAALVPLDAVFDQEKEEEMEPIPYFQRKRDWPGRVMRGLAWLGAAAVLYGILMLLAERGAL